jgi:hypothetical protein
MRSQLAWRSSLASRSRVLRPSCMRRRLHIQVVFESARLSADHLRSAYELVVPVVQREVRAEAAGHDQPSRGRARPRREGKVA